MKAITFLKKISSFLLIVISISSCQLNKSSINKNIFLENKWYLGETLIFRNDSSVCFTEFDSISNKKSKEQNFDINLTDSSLVLTRYQQKGYFDSSKEFKATSLEKQVDTVKYDFKIINKQPKLILYTDPFPTILSAKSDINLPETNNFEQIKFKISDYTIGDQIDRSFLKTRGIYNYPNYTIEDCEYINNKDITFKIIGYNTIYSIERKRIEHYRIKEIVEVVTTKLEVQPEYRPMRQWVDGSDYEYEFYRWSGHGVQINLSRSKYVGDESYRTLVGHDTWTLSYDDSFIQSILVETYRNGKTSSAIIN
ncbi:MAG: hypothetical protein PF517_09595 [Salinivirgaceae bacterium]|jgi:hypothetical protein|nr:hypothetical protein [Salinivirgaceae bacterium]